MLFRSQFGNEQPFIESIVEMYDNIKPEFLNSSNLSPFEGIKQSVQLFGEPLSGAGNVYWLIDLFRKSSNNNYGSVLLGEFGNANISWIGVVDELPILHLKRRYGTKKTVKLKLNKWLLSANQRIFYTYHKLKHGNDFWRPYSYISRQFEKSSNIVQLMKRKEYYSGIFRYSKKPKDDMYQVYDNDVLRLFLGAHLGHELGLELRDPTNDIRVIQYSASIPNEMFAAPKKRQMVRTMMNGKLPDIVRLNTKKGRQSSDLSSRVLIEIGRAHV